MRASATRSQPFRRLADSRRRRLQTPTPTRAVPSNSSDVGSGIALNVSKLLSLPPLSNPRNRIAWFSPNRLASVMLAVSPSANVAEPPAGTPVAGLRPPCQSPADVLITNYGPPKGDTLIWHRADAAPGFRAHAGKFGSPVTEAMAIATFAAAPR